MLASDLWHCWANGTLIEYLRYTFVVPARYWVVAAKTTRGNFSVTEAADGPVASISAEDLYPAG
jgi:hypothetical protein